ncbi:MAG: hypothetical protein D6798_09085 [Deltaproteobacteria bacterium]|nr:MAG: hypothetical protein D6798_09085 [Deltaproteobacteria bacterium]
MKDYTRRGIIRGAAAVGALGAATPVCAAISTRQPMVVIGVGDCGGNMLNAVVRAGLAGVDLVAVNTDADALARSLAAQKLLIGAELTRGLGAGANPRVGQQAALESAVALRDLVAQRAVVVLVAGMGGGTGTGASPVIAGLAKGAGAYTVGMVTAPFDLEGRRRRCQALEGVHALWDTADAVVVRHNEELIRWPRPVPTAMSHLFGLVDAEVVKLVTELRDLLEG